MGCMQAGARLQKNQKREVWDRIYLGILTKNKMIHWQELKK